MTDLVVGLYYSEAAKNNTAHTSVDEHLVQIHYNYWEE